MAITKLSGRQEVIASQPVTIAWDTLSSDAAVAEAVFDIPANAIIVGGGIVVDTAFNSTTSDVLDLGDGSDDDRYTPTPINLQATGFTAWTVTGFKYTTADTIDLEWTAGAASTATAGSARLWLEYIVDGRAAFSEG
ncbi:MAG: hypothetical protein GTO02_07745 [Candidatus Dadabacteria bacterium]|nr:hypothetical protein [Candidatus Dadabacteria bacterium]